MYGTEHPLHRIGVPSRVGVGGDWNDNMKYANGRSNVWAQYRQRPLPLYSGSPERRNQWCRLNGGFGKMASANVSNGGSPRLSLLAEFCLFVFTNMDVCFTSINRHSRWNE
jgi:hypothetical protein